MNLTKGMAVRILPGARSGYGPTADANVWLRDNVGAVVTVDDARPDEDGDVHVSGAVCPAGTYVLPEYLGPVEPAPALPAECTVTASGRVVRALPDAPPAPTYADRVQALKDAVATFANARGFHDGLSPEKALTVAAFLLGEAPR